VADASHAARLPGGLVKGFALQQEILTAKKIFPVNSVKRSLQV
jgi:hypothetical protein